MRQSSRLPPLLPACFAVLLFEAMAGVTCLDAQTRYRAVLEENFRRAASPDAVELARVSEGSEMIGLGVDGNWVEVRLDGWIWSASVQTTSQDAHDLRVLPRDGENLRAEPNASADILARFYQGALLDEVEREGNWIRVRRVGWIWSRSLQLITPPASATPDPISTSSDEVTLDRAVTAQQSQLLNVPDGDERGVLNPDAPVRVIARSGEWVRIQTEGWIREENLRAATAGVLEGITGAEVRASPAEFEGRLLQWTVQYLAIQEADELRGEIAAGQQYMLTRGPLPEAGFVYIVIPPDAMAEVQSLAPLTEVVIIGRVRAARSRYLGNPIIDMVDMAIREQ